MLLTLQVLPVIYAEHQGMLTEKNNNEISVIVEVIEDPHEAAKKIKQNEPSVQVITTYELLFNGIALKGKYEAIQKVMQESFIRGVYPAQTYVQLYDAKALSKLKDKAIFPNDINTTSYTGKGVKIAVIDTGIDMAHPDLTSNYKGGFDLVDLDDTPDETQLHEGMPTTHGTHVAGIIAANGAIKGVAPDAEIYAYRALGPGGVGTSIHVIAALEEAVKQNVDIINLSLGNNVNGPDYPTSKAVNEAVKHGIAVVVANGNSGPEHWTVGSPATATHAFSVGAYQDERQMTYLVEQQTKKKIRLYPIRRSRDWSFSNGFLVTDDEDVTKVFGKIVLLTDAKEGLLEKMRGLLQAGAVAILTDQESSIEITHLLSQTEFDIPIAFIANTDKNYIMNQIKSNRNHHFQIVKEQTKETIANFSSRGPVTLNWHIKPNVIAPGVDILSTVPSGYDIYSGTSMATPHVAGAIALIKEAHPNWTNEQIFAAIETTARKLYNQSGELIPAYVQGAGVMQIEDAINASIVIENGLLSFGKIDQLQERLETTITIHNHSNETKQFYFKQPHYVSGLTFELPKAFYVNANDKKTIPIKLKVNRHLMKNDVEDGWISLHSGNEKFLLPYILLKDSSNFVKVSGFQFQINPLKSSTYEYEIYVTEKVKSLEVQLFDPQTLLYETTLLRLEKLDAGFHKGELPAKRVKGKGFYYGIIVVQLEDGQIETYEISIQI